MSWYMSPDDRIHTQEMVQCYGCLAKRITPTDLSVFSCLEDLKDLQLEVDVRDA